MKSAPPKEPAVSFKLAIAPSSLVNNATYISVSLSYLGEGFSISKASVNGTSPKTSTKHGRYILQV